MEVRAQRSDQRSSNLALQTRALHSFGSSWFRSLFQKLFARNKEASQLLSCWTSGCLITKAGEAGNQVQGRGLTPDTSALCVVWRKQRLGEDQGQGKPGNGANPDLTKTSSRESPHFTGLRSVMRKESVSVLRPHSTSTLSYFLQSAALQAFHLKITTFSSGFGSWSCTCLGWQRSWLWCKLCSCYKLEPPTKPGKVSPGWALPAL